MTTVRQAALARRQLDRRLGELGPPSRFAVPRSGWLRAIRSALGMSAAVLARRLEVSPQAVRAMELSELDGGIRLRTLQRAARAMDCEFVYAVVPRTTLADIVEPVSAPGSQCLNSSVRTRSRTSLLTIMAKLL